MSGASIAAEVAAAYAEAGMVLGTPHSLYRPTLATVPALDPQNLLRSVLFASSSTPDGSFKRPSKYADDSQFGLFDARVAVDAHIQGDDTDMLLDGVSGSAIVPASPVQPGDYIDGSTGTFFVASLKPFEPIAMVECNCIASGARSAGIQAGLNTVYGGRTTATDSPQFVSWPISLLPGGSAQAGRAELPGDPKRFAGVKGKVPVIPGVLFQPGDRIIVDIWLIDRGLALSSAYLIDGAILGTQGWQLTLSSAEA